MTTELIPVAGGGRIWAEKAGNGPALVLLHGSVHDSRLWSRVFAALARHRTVVRYDARGHGRSTPPTAPFRHEDDLLAVLDRFDVQSAGLVGLSMGGEVALDFTLEHPGRVRSLTPIGASAGGHEWPRSPELDAYAAAHRGSSGGRIAELELALWASLGDRAPGFEVIEAMVRENAEVGAAAEKGHALDPAEDPSAVWSGSGFRRRSSSALTTTRRSASSPHVSPTASRAHGSRWSPTPITTCRCGLRGDFSNSSSTADPTALPQPSLSGCISPYQGRIRKHE